MAAPELIVFIVDRGRGEKLISLCRSEGAAFSLLLHGRGTAGGGRGGVEKDVVLLSVDSARAGTVMENLCAGAGIGKHGGAAFMLPFSALVSQQMTEALFLGDLKLEKKKSRLAKLMDGLTGKRCGNEGE